MSMRYRHYTNLFGHQVEFSSELAGLPQGKYFRREPKSQKSQLNSIHQHGQSKGRKRPMQSKTMQSRSDGH